MNEALLAIVVVLALACAGMLAWMLQLTGRLGKRDDELDNVRRELSEINRAAANVAMAKALLDTERLVGSNVQAMMNKLTERFAADLEKSLDNVAQQMEIGVSRVLGEHLKTLKALGQAAVTQMESGASDFIGHYRDAVGSLGEVSTRQLQQMGSATLDELQKVRDTAGSIGEVSARRLEELGSATLDELQKVRDAATAQIEQVTQNATDAVKGVNDTASAASDRLAEELRIAAEKHQQELMERFDARIADVVAAYVTETLGSDVDLGAQGPYLLRMLEEHKDDLRAEILGPGAR